MIPLKDDNPRSKTPVVTIGLIVINILVFYFEIKFGVQAFVLRFGAIPMNILHGQALPTLFTSMFLHGGFLHVGGNMLYLWIFGDNVENIMGRGKFLAFYVLCGLIAAFTHIIMSGSSQVPMVGASGAIAGVLGAYVVKFPRAKVLVLIPLFWFIIFKQIPALFVLGFWFLLQLFSGFVVSGVQQSDSGGVAFWAHIGGFVAGMLLVHVFAKKKKSQWDFEIR